VTEVSQSAYGHPARKRTWLLVANDEQPAPLDWSEPEATHQVSYGQKDGEYWKKPLTKKQAKASPPAFAEMLIELARGAR